MSLQTEAASLKALIATATAKPALDVSEIEKLTTLPPVYTEVHLSYVVSGDMPRRQDGSREYGLRRLTTRGVGTTVNNVYDLQTRTLAAFHNQTVTIAGVPTVVELEVPADPPGPDDGKFSAATDWTYGL